MRRLWTEILIVLIITALFMSRVYEFAPPALQLVLLKMLIVSMAIAHAHVVGKLLFGTVNWDGEIRVRHMARMALYAIFPICYAISG